MPRLCVNCSLVWLLYVLLGFIAMLTQAKTVLTVPQEVNLSPDLSAQQLSISWIGGAATTFDLIILRTEFNETVFFDTLSAIVNEVTGQHQWNWTSVEPLECTSLSVKIRSRDGQTTSEWSNTEILQGRDIPSHSNIQMYPQDRIVPVGSSTTFCCIVEEKGVFDSIHYETEVMNVTRLSRRSYVTTAVNRTPFRRSGNNVFCFSNEKMKLAGAVVFVGYPPLPTNFVCETYDLSSAVCQWNVGQDTYLYGKRRTRYSINKRDCTEANLLKNLERQKNCLIPQWRVASPWLLRMLLASTASLTLLNSLYRDESEMGELLSAVIRKYKGEHTFSGVGLRSVDLSELYPGEDFSVQVRCGAQNNFWKWGSWSKLFSFTTKTYVPYTPDVWMFTNGDNTGQVLWKPPRRRQIHCPITGYEVTFWSPEENLQHREILSPDTYAAPVNLTQMAFLSSDDKVVASVLAKNCEGSSQLASVPLRLTNAEPNVVSRALYEDRGFSLYWSRDTNTTCGYVVDWYDASCTYNCLVDWIKVPDGNINVSIASVNFQPGVRYTFNLYSCSSGPLELLHRWQGYSQELAPSSSVSLESTQQASDVLLTWGEIPLVNRRGFILGYNVYISNGSQSTLLANISNVKTRNYTVKGLSVGSYKFTVKAYTSAGEDTGTTAAITFKPYTDWLILEMLASLGILTLFLVIVTFICYKKRQWVKKAFYPDIPEPKLPGDWSRTKGPLHVKPSPHSKVHIVEKPQWDSSKEVLVVIPEEDEDSDGYGMGDEPVDTDEPTSLRYYNQVVDDRPIRPRFPDSSTSSASSLDSAHTDVTYTGIQTSGSSLVFQLDHQGPSEGHQPQADQSVSCEGEGGGYRPQMQPRAPIDEMGQSLPGPFLEPQDAGSGAYRSQCSWHLDSPVEDPERGSLAPSLGSPTSVASTQFLLPNGEEDADEKPQPSSSAITWFTNLLSSAKP
ncbi:LIF receptor subunit alpha a [Pholidichthys leucotaenia]